MKPAQANVMVVIPHPDDAELGCAGTVARWVAEGKEVVYVVCTNGDKGTSDPAVKPADLARRREQEQLAAAKMLGVRDTVFLRYSDQSLEDDSAFRREIVRLLRIYRPETVLTVDPQRRYPWHRDHRITGQVTLDAIYPFARDHLAYPELWENSLTPHKVSEVYLWGPEEPNCCIDITAAFARKIDALSCHESQVGGRLPELEKHLRMRAQQAAEKEDFDLGEAFFYIDIWW